MQDDYDCIYCIVDLHAITVPQNPETLRDAILRTAATTLAVGIDPAQALLFVQSDVPEHAELAWLLNCFTYHGELGQMTQFKDKARVRGVGTSTGLFTYPVLMTSDILLYDTHAVPVGEDQRQHLELARLTARRVNKQFDDLFVVPAATIPKAAARVMGLDDPTAKMSKTASSAFNYVAFSDDADTIRKKIRKAVTDSGTDIRFDPGTRPAISNLLTIFGALSGRSPEEVAAAYQGKGYGHLKNDLAETVVEALAPIQGRIADHLSDLPGLRRILADGAEKARAIARPKVAEFRRRLGLGPGS